MIAGLELDPGLVEKALQGLLGWDKELEDEQQIAVALGYVAHLVDRLAAYLQVPLRFPIHPGQSISAILEHAYPCGTYRFVPYIPTTAGMPISSSTEPHVCLLSLACTKAILTPPPPPAGRVGRIFLRPR